jgi:LacI family transcriptional regulator
MKKITIKDIANEAGVSISTVSFVINDKGEKMGISPAVIKKVKDIAEKLYYRPSMIASSLRTGKTRSIGLIVEDISNHFFSHLARVIENEAAKLGYRVFYCSIGNDDNESDELVQSLLQANVDGFIITPTKLMEQSIDKLLKLNKPVVLIDRYFANQNVSHVVMDNYEAAYDATQYLINSGYKNIALVNNSSGMIQMQLREKGYTDVIKKNNLFNESNILYIDFPNDEEVRVSEITRFLKNNPNIDAVLFLTNYLGLAGLHVVKNLGLQVPKDLAILSFDDHYSFRLHTPTITVIEQPLEEIATQAVEILMSQMMDEKKEEVHKVMKKGKLVIREST